MRCVWSIGYQEESWEMKQEDMCVWGGECDGPALLRTFNLMTKRVGSQEDSQIGGEQISTAESSFWRPSVWRMGWHNQHWRQGEQSRSCGNSPRESWKDRSSFLSRREGNKNNYVLRCTVSGLMLRIQVYLLVTLEPFCPLF